MIKKVKKINSAGFVILFAVTISAILLAVALGVANIALKEVKFGTNAIETNNAFFAADTAIESILFLDKPPSSPYVLISPDTQETWMIPPITGLGSTGNSCAIVTVTKNSPVPPSVETIIISKGYNVGDASCESTNSDRIEREIKVEY